MTHNPEEILCTLIGVHVQQSIDLLGAVASDHIRGVPMARTVGVTDTDFLFEDLAAIWLCLETGFEQGRDKGGVAELARGVLRRQGHWDPQEGPISDTTSRWSAETLVRLLCSYPGPSAVPTLAAEFQNTSRVTTDTSCAETCRWLRACSETRR